ncbi:MAG: hypothetical protein HY775_10945 [Acidobacteria bacterium]|nr:hypothetical protein [Acidobacteriota bacterium]
MDALFPHSAGAILLGVLAIVFALAWLARARPHVAWLQVFRLPTVHRSEEQRAARRRSANRMAALELILAGLVLPLVYVALTVMMFNDLKTLPMLLVGAGSVTCVGLGIWAFLRNR